MSKHVDTAGLHADAIERSLRTLWTGFGIDAAIAIGAGTLLLLDGSDVSSPVFWNGLGVLVLKSTLTAAASYLVRLKVTPKST